jgi:ribosome-binding protein aMBF1 (putative translation factor)
VPVPFSRLKAKWRQDPEFVAAYEHVAQEMRLAFQIAEARRRAGLTQQELAERIQTKQSVVARWESGRQKPSTRNLERIAKATGSRLIQVLEPA